MPDHEDRAILLRQHLQTAQVTRAELFESDARRKHVTFHDLRATGITWSAVRGDDPLRIKQRAGHKAFSTTEVYIREAENLREGFGEPFPTLPVELTAISASISAFGVARPTAQPNFPGSEWSNGGSNPGPPHCERGALPAELLPQEKSRCHRCNESPTTEPREDTPTSSEVKSIPPLTGIRPPVTGQAAPSRQSRRREEV